jgi:Pectate lyase superfamily protein/Chitobiase/beta-hexosaminidase C-terminal domain
MIKKLALAFLVLFTVTCAHAQAWSGIITGTGSGGNARAIDWSSSGMPGGIPVRTVNCSTISSTGSDQTVAINSALSSCTAGEVVFLNAGTYQIGGIIVVPSNVTLRGASANLTILNSTGTSGSPTIQQGAAVNSIPAIAGQTAITGGLTAGSTSITVASATGFSVGELLLITQLNDSSFVDITGNGTACTFCDGGIGYNGTRVQGQIVQITSVVGTTIGITSKGSGAQSGGAEPGIYYPYTLTPMAVPFSPAATLSGVENLTVFANNTHSGGNISFYQSECSYCWVTGSGANWTDGDWFAEDFSFHSVVANNYFTGAYLHGPGTFDSNIDIRSYSSGWLVQNNILERGHFPLMMEWGANGGVAAYNYVLGSFDQIDFIGSGTPGPTVDPCTPSVACSNTPGFNFHGAHPWMILSEGNEGSLFEPDNTWGSSSDTTTFRDWWKGVNFICKPGGNVRATTDCSTGKTAFQISNAMEIDSQSTSFNIIGDVIGSAAQQVLVSTQGGSSLGQLFQVTAQCGGGISTNCGANSRPFGSNAVAYSFGYTSEADTGGGSGTLTPFTTALINGNYTNMNSTTTWIGGTVVPLPQSFYLSSSKPVWFGSAPWPLNGPDVTGGFDAGGHANKTPARLCYESLGGTNGNGSPFTNFNAATCYAASTVMLAPSSQNFGSHAVGVASSPQTFTVTNNSATNATSVTVSPLTGQFAVSSNTCTGTVTASGGTCTFVVTFTAGSTGLQSETLSVSYGGGDGASPQTSALSGTGTPIGTVATPVISPTSGAAPQTVTITDSTSGAVICYTTNGATPTAATPGTCDQNTYSGPLSITVASTVRTIGTLVGATNSSIASATFTSGTGATVSGMSGGAKFSGGARKTN